MTDCVLCVRKEDLKYADDLKKAYALPIEVEEGQQIQLGGFIIENKTTNVVVDESLDSNLEAQKIGSIRLLDWWLNRGLKMSENVIYSINGPVVKVKMPKTFQC